MKREQFNPEMLILARESRGYSQSDLAYKIGLLQAHLSKIESGLIGMSDEILDAIATELKYPLSFFSQETPKHGFASNCLYHRKRQTVPVSDLRKVTAQIRTYLLGISHLLKSIDIKSENRFHRLDIVDYGHSPEVIAQLVRRSWGIPSGAIGNLTTAIENAGGIVVGFSFGTTKIDAMSQWAYDMPPIICINTDAPGDRLRFSLAHELGHIVMHQIPTPDLETEANRFASEFLMPKADIAPYLTRLSLAKLATLKPYWKVSMQALLERAYNLKKITANQRQYFWRQISKAGYKMEEPIEVPFETPQTIYDIVDIHRNDLGFSIPELSEVVRVSEKEFKEKYLPPNTNSHLRLVA